MRHLNLLLIAVLFVACPKKSEPEKPAAAATAEPDHAAVEHAHAAPHGGTVKSISRGHVELVSDASGAFKVFLLDEKLGARPPGETAGSVKVASEGYADVPLKAVGDHLEGKGEALAGTHLTAVVALHGGGVQELVRFRLHLEPHDGKPGAVRGDRESVVGVITDSTCVIRGDALSGEHGRECALRCIQGGAPIAVVEEKTNRIYVATAPQGKSITDLLIPFVGQRAELYGKVVRSGGSQFLVVEDVAPEHEHSSKEGGVVAMAGELHLEVLALKSGEVRVFLSDAFRKPLPPDGRKGKVDARQGTFATSTTALEPDPTGRFLGARFPAFGEGQVEVTVRLPVEEDPNYFITFMLEAKSEGEAAAPAVKASAGPVAAKLANGVQEIHIGVEGHYEPAQIALKRGVPAKLYFLRQDSGMCSSELMIPSLKVKKELAEFKETLVEVTFDKAGEIPFSCGMGMMKGTFFVTD